MVLFTLSLPFAIDEYTENEGMVAATEAVHGSNGSLAGFLGTLSETVGAVRSEPSSMALFTSGSSTAG